MSSSKRYTETHSTVPEKNTSARNPTGATNRNGASQLPHQANKHRPRFTSGHANPKLTVPRPVNLPSLRKENENHEGQSHTAPPTTGGQSRQRHEETPVLDPSPWAHHGAPRQALWTRGPHEEAMTGFHTRPPVLNQEEFPSLEVATHSKGALPKTKPHRAAPEHREAYKEWADDEHRDMPSALPPRSNWEEDERYGHMGEMHMQYGPTHLQHPAYVPVMSHALPSAEYYGPPYYHPRPAYYAPAPAVMQPSYRPGEYYGHPGDGYYTPYVHAVYPAPQMAANYAPPEMYPEQAAYPVPPPPQELPNEPLEDLSPEAEEEFEDELRYKAVRAAERFKSEAEHPKTPDNASGEGPVRLFRRQPSGEAQPKAREINHRNALRRQSLPKSGSDQLRPRLDSTDLDWEAQVVAEEKFNKRQEIKILSRPSTDTVPSIASSQDNGQSRRGRSEAMAADRWRPAHSPMTRERTGRDRSADASATAASEKSTSGRWTREEPSWYGQQSGNITPSSQQTAQTDPGLHEGWTDVPDAGSRGRGFRGRGRGRYGGGRGFTPRQEPPLSPAAAPRGRCYFPGRGFRPNTGPPRPIDAPAAPSENMIHFGQFSRPLNVVNGEFDPFAGRRPDNRGPYGKGHGRGRAVDDLLRNLNPQNRTRDTQEFPEHPMEPAREVPYVRTMLPDSFGPASETAATPRRSAVSTPTSRSQTRSERGGYRGRPYRGRGRGRGFRGRYSGGYPHPRPPREPSSPATASERIAASDVGSRTSEDGRASTSHFRPDGWGCYDHRDRHPRPPGRGGPGRRGRGRGRGRDASRGFTNFRPQRPESQERSAPVSQKMHWVPKKPSSDAPSSGRPAEE